MKEYMSVEGGGGHFTPVSPGGLSETSNKQIILSLNPFKHKIKMKQYMSDEGGTLYPKLECPLLLQVNLYYVTSRPPAKNDPAPPPQGILQT